MRMKEVVAASDITVFPSTESIESRIICRICQKQFSRYTCPRCDSRYCSLQCYKTHSSRCTESFMRENVMEELQQIRVEDETRLKMLDILKRFHMEEEMDGEEDEDACLNSDEETIISEETVRKVLSGNEVRLEDLSAEELKQFRRAVASGELSKMIEPWTPWWKKPSARTVSLGKSGSRLVTPLQGQEDIQPSSSGYSGDDPCDIPPGPESPLPPLRRLTLAEPSPSLLVHLVDILYGYCFALRLYNGDWQGDPSGASDTVLSISKVLGDDGRPETVTEALSACLEQTCSPDYKHAGGLKFGVGLIDDITCLLYLGTDALICSLCDLRRLIMAGDGLLKSTRRSKAELRWGGRKLKSAERKVYFLMCWVHEQPAEAWPSLAAIVGVEKASLSSSVGFKGVKAGGKEVAHSKVLIEM